MIRSVLESLVRPDTHDQPAQFTDAELKAAAEAAHKELTSRGWRLWGITANRPGLRYRKETEL